MSQQSISTLHSPSWAQPSERGTKPRNLNIGRHKIQAGRVAAELLSTLDTLTVISMRPADCPPMVMSKNTTGRDMAVIEGVRGRVGA